MGKDLNKCTVIHLSRLTISYKPLLLFCTRLPHAPIVLGLTLLVLLITSEKKVRYYKVDISCINLSCLNIFKFCESRHNRRFVFDVFPCARCLSGEKSTSLFGLVKDFKLMIFHPYAMDDWKVASYLKIFQISFLVKIIDYHIYQTSPLGQDMTQGQFLCGV